MSKKDFAIEVTPLKIDSLTNDKYQRVINYPRVNRIVEEFDERRFDPITVSIRDGARYVLDGQHRLAALKRLGMAHVPSRILRGLTIQEEAEIFVKQGDLRRGLSSFEKHQAAVIWGEETAIAIENLLTRLGLRVVKAQSAAYGVSSIASLNEIAKKDGVATLEKILSLLIDTWAGSSDSLQKVMIQGIRELYAGYPEMEQKKFVKQLKKVDPAVIIREGKSVLTGRSTYEGYVQALLKHYNRNLRNDKKLSY